MEMTPQKWQNTCAYLRDVFGAVGCTEAKDGPIPKIDHTLRGWEERARAAGLPAIAVSPDVGHFLTVLATLATSARNAVGRIIEVGTLGGYSAMWMARGMLMSGGRESGTGRLLTIEYDPKHAAFARAEFERAGLAGFIEIVPGAGLDVLKRLAAELGPSSVDMVFLDAEKTEYQGYADLAGPMLRKGGLLVADNALGSGSWWITDGAGSHPDARARDSHAAVDAFNRAIAADAEFEASCVPIREGVMIAVKR